MPQYDTAALISACRVISGEGFRLAERPTRIDVPGIDKQGAEAALADAVRRMDGLQQRLYAEDRQSLLVIFQAIDGGGKDSTIRAVFSGINPQGCQVMSFKAPGPEELAHDFLWRHMQALPARGRIAVHNRSWYEEVLVARVHADVLARRKLPARCVSADIWRERLEDIAGFERYLARQGVVVLKFFLHLGKEEQRQRFLARIDEPEKNWKFDAHDVAERAHWDAYQRVYEEAVAGTATPHAPWFVVPADRKWLARLIVAEALVAALTEADPRYPEPDPKARALLLRERAKLEKEG
ncbi:polyphosphate kinase 2 family protein [Roseomonas marmotae]|uniref:Polyphosphate kinase 2 family protein n=1 Tax=Roseomonas marmotae TaxID=2768161 RepID=A0ABS3K6B6_9PROT|nr:polyphosphate kinase 2 family protein [Roseomonas marmotae]MBO1072994.1 polyphosphate kinase 2 family protein [Roseomonas marmotae]QTI79357.1 polyphosphate kinase 2 family protein [Roseomonas marmotae]